MRDAGLIELRRHDPDVVGQRAGDLLDDLQPRRMNAVVVGAENSHPSKCLLVQVEAGACLWASSYPAIAAEANRPIPHVFFIQTRQGRANLAPPSIFICRSGDSCFGGSMATAGGLSSTCGAAVSIAGTGGATTDADPACGCRVRATASPLSKSAALSHSLARMRTIRSSSHRRAASISNA